MRLLVLAIAGLFAGFALPHLVAAAYRWITSLGGQTMAPLTIGYLPSVLALAGAVLVPMTDVLVRRWRNR